MNKHVQNRNYKHNRKYQNKTPSNRRNNDNKPFQQKKNVTSFKKQIFIEIPNMKKKQKKINKFLIDTHEQVKIIHKNGELLVTNKGLHDTTNIQCESYKRMLKYNNDTDITMYVNKFENTKTHSVCQIPYHHNVIKQRIQTYKLNSEGKVTLYIEKSIVFDETMKDYETNLDDDDNDIIYNYYFMLENENEDSYFIKEDIFAFLNSLN